MGVRKIIIINIFSKSRTLAVGQRLPAKAVLLVEILMRSDYTDSDIREKTIQSVRLKFQSQLII
jgi:hypothetical protein